MHRKNSSLIQNASLNVIKTGVTILFPIITFMYSSRIFLTDGVGKINFAKSFTMYFTMLAMLGIVNYGTREAVKVREDRTALSRLAHELFMINTASAVLAYILFFGAMFLVHSLNAYRTLLLINGFSIALTVIGMEWLFSAVEDYRYITVRTCVFNFGGLILILLFIRSAEDIYKYALIQTLSGTGANIMNLFYSRKYIDWRWMGSYRIGKHLRPILTIFLMTLFVQVFTHLDTTMLTMMAGDSATGLYTAANRMAGMVSQLITAVAMVFMPRLTYQIQAGNRIEINRLCKDAVHFILLLGIPASIGLYMLGREIIVLFSGAAFLEAAVTSKILSLRVLLVPLNSFIVLYLFIPLKLEKNNLVSTGAAALLNFTMNFFSIPLIQQNGAAFSTVAAEGIELIINLFFLAKLMNVRSLFRGSWQYIAAALWILPLHWLFSHICQGTLLIVMLVIFSAVFYFASLAFLKNSYMTNAMQFIKNRVEKR